MPWQNRVTPFGQLLATPERGTLNGNRGCLHDDVGQIRRQFREIRWIICLLEFKGRRHPIMKPGRYTDLFFLDEATALAAGHRPCGECQRDRFNLFRKYWAKANPGETGSVRPLAPVIDTVLHRQRIGSKEYCDSIDQLPDGTFVTANEIDAYLVSGGKILRWSPAGYAPVKLSNIKQPFRILTPSSTVNALKAGYPVTFHHTAVRR